MANKLDGDAGSISNMDIDSTAINGLVAVHYELLLQCYHHIEVENDPERLVLDNSMAQSARPGVNRVVITRISDNIETAITASNGVSTKTYTATSQALAIDEPIRITTPAIINGISSCAGISQFPSVSAVKYAPVFSKNNNVIALKLQL